MKAFSRAEKLPKPKLGEMFNDVWGVAPGEEVPAVIVRHLVLQRRFFYYIISLWLLQMEQRAELGRLLKKYGEVWPPWKKELKKFVEQGEDVMDCDGKGS